MIWSAPNRTATTSAHATIAATIVPRERTLSARESRSRAKTVSERRLVRALRDAFDERLLELAHRGVERDAEHGDRHVGLHLPAVDDHRRDRRRPLVGLRRLLSGVVSCRRRGDRDDP